MVSDSPRLDNLVSEHAISQLPLHPAVVNRREDKHRYAQYLKVRKTITQEDVVTALKDHFGSAYLKSAFPPAEQIGPRQNALKTGEDAVKDFANYAGKNWPKKDKVKQRARLDEIESNLKASLKKDREMYTNLREKGNAVVSEYDKMMGYFADFNLQLKTAHISYTLTKLDNLAAAREHLKNLAEGKEEQQESKKAEKQESKKAEKQQGASAEADTALQAKIAEQQQALSLPFKSANEANIRESLPLLYSEQQTDVVKAENRFFAAGKKGYLMANGTGTGKTFSGGGVIRRFIQAGRNNILTVAPAGMTPVWDEDTQKLGLQWHVLTGVNDAGVEDKVNVTSFENFASNPALMARHWDLIVFDEAHKLQQNMQGTTTNAANAMRLMANVDGHYLARARASMQAEYEQLQDKITKQIEKLKKQQPDANPVTLDKMARAHGPIASLHTRLDKKAERLAKGFEKAEKKQATRVLLLSATPFATDKNVLMADGLLFDSAEGASDSQAYNTGSFQEQYLVKNFGYSMRYNKANQPGPEVDRGLLARDWSDRLVDTGAMTRRRLQLSYDYSREFVKVNSVLGEQIDRGIEILSDKKYNLLSQQLWDKLKGGNEKILLEGLRVAESLERIEQQLALGRKVVVFHERQEIRVPHLFQFDTTAKTNPDQYKAQREQFYREHSDLVSLPLSGIRSVPQAILERFGSDRVALFSGRVNKTQRKNDLAVFNDDKGRKDILVVQKQAGKEGLSPHDQSGKFPRALMIMNTPNSPTDLIQIEGRVYRSGLKTNAVIELPSIGTRLEAWSYRDVVASRTSMAESLAMGSSARDLRNALREGYLNPRHGAPDLQQGIGGKELDAFNDEMTEFVKARTYYYQRPKRNSKNKAKEGKDYFATPEPLGLKMVHWLDLQAGEKALEPSAGHGAIARWLPDNVEKTAVEPSGALNKELGILFDGKVVDGTFENLHAVNKYHGIAMNPPFGTAGKTAMEHVEKAFNHLKDGGRVVALIPDGPAMQKRFDNWYEQQKDAYLVGEVSLPTAVFERAGTSVKTRVVLLDKNKRGEQVPAFNRYDLSGETSINKAFERLENMDFSPRADVSVSAADMGYDLRVRAATTDRSEQYVLERDEWNYNKPANVLHGAELNKLAKKYHGEPLGGGRQIFERKADMERFLDAVSEAYLRKDLSSDDDAVVPLSLSKQPAVGQLSRGEAESVIRTIEGGLRDTGRGTIVRDTFADFPPAIQQVAEHHPTIKAAQGFVYQQKVYLNLEHIKNRQTLEEVYIHERLRHYGFRKLFGSQLHSMLLDIHDQIGRERIKELLEQRGVPVDDYIAYYQNRNGGEEKVKFGLVDELLAFLEESDVESSVWQKIKGYVTRLKLWLRQNGFTLWRVKESDLINIVHAASDSVKYKEYDAARFNQDLGPVDETPPLMLGRPQVAQQAFARIHRGVREQAKSMKSQGIKGLIANTVADTRKHWLALIPRRYLKEFSEGSLPSIYAYMRRANQLDADRNHLMQMPAQIVDEWRDYAGQSPEDAKRLAQLMHHATIAGVDPSKTYQPLRDDKKFDQRNFMLDAHTNDEFATGEEITPEYVANRIKVIKEQARSRAGEGTAKFMERIKYLKNRLKQEQNRKRSKAELDAAWSALTPAGQAMFEKVRDSYLEQNKEYQQALEARIAEIVTDERHRQAWLDKVRMMFETQRAEGPYFPLQRFGEYFATVKDGAGNVLEFVKFEKQAQQQAWKEARQTTLAEKEYIETGVLMTGASDSVKQVDPEYHAKVMKTLNENGIQAGLMDEINQLYLQMLPEMSARKHFIHRKKVAGYNPDALRAYAHNMFHGAYQLARMKHSHKMEHYLREMRKEAREAPDSNRASNIVSEMTKRHEWAMNPKSSAWTAKATSLGFAWYLGVTPAAALVNVAQTPMVALPVLGSRFGYIKAAKALLRASQEFIKGGFHAEKHLKGAERKAFEAFQRSGLLEKTQSHDLAGVGEGGLEYGSTWHKVMTGVSFLFHHAERYNREVTAMAAYRLAKEAGKGDPISVADDLTKEAHFDYSNAERARWMQNDAAKVLLLFRQHSVNMTYRLARDFNNMFRGVSPTVRRQAQRQFAGMMGIGMMFAGTAGLPLYSVIGNLLELVFDDEDEPWEFETEFRLFLAEHLGEQAAKVVVHGALDELTGATISSRVSMNNLWLRDPDAAIEGRAQVQYYAEQALGPLFGIALSGGTALNLINEGQLQRGMEFMLPKALKDGLRGIRYANEGVTSLRGDQLIEEVSTLDNIWQVLGFTPSSVSERYDQNRAIKSTEKRILRRRQVLLRQYALATRLRDREWRSEINHKITVYNKANPTVAITGKAKVQSLRRRKAYSRNAINGLIIDKRLRNLLADKTFTVE